ncbi:MAG: AAA family ATPase [Candidatus Goldbacteria bacterium]|nr:AAA family ATPase [Candidatus Goldiibacteriota bacterium]
MAIKDIIGNKKAKDMLLSFAKSKKAGTSYIINGEEGVGKTFAALQFAKAINCLNQREDGDCCDICENCRLLDKILGQLDADGFQQYPHPDVMYITTDKAQITIDLVRDSLSRLNAYRQIKLKYKILILNDAEKMNKEASNSVLKELEEPGDFSIIILVVNNIQKILPTIVSRCQRINIMRADEREIEEKLIQLGMDENSAKQAIMFCDGKIEKALNFKEIKSDILFAREIFLVLASKIDNVDGIFEIIKSINEKMEENKTRKIKGGMENMTYQRLFLLDILKMLSYIYKDFLLDKLGIKKIITLKYNIDINNIKEMDFKVINTILKLINVAQMDLMANANINLLLYNLLFNIRKVSSQQ